MRLTCRLQSYNNQFISNSFTSQIIFRVKRVLKVSRSKRPRIQTNCQIAIQDSSFWIFFNSSSGITQGTDQWLRRDRPGDTMENFRGGFHRQGHHRRSEVYLPSTTPDCVFPIVLAYRPVVYEAEHCQATTKCDSWPWFARIKPKLASGAGGNLVVEGFTTCMMLPWPQQSSIAGW